MEETFTLIDGFNSRATLIAAGYYAYFVICFLSMAACIIGIFVILFRKNYKWKWVVNGGWIAAGVTSFAGVLLGMASVNFGGSMVDMCNILQKSIT